MSNESDVTCRYGTHAPRDCPARVFALSGTTPPACPVADRIILCETPKGCTCGAPADTPSGMHHDHCSVNPAEPDGSGCRVCKIAPSGNRSTPGMTTSGDADA